MITTPNDSRILAATAPATRAAIGLGRADWRNLGIMLLGFACVLALVPPVRAFPMDDDWAYAQSVNDLLNLSYRPHDWTQPTALGHLVWGALFSGLFGQSFTTLSAAMLLISAACLVVLYLLLRQLGVAATPALLGAALFGLNPMYVYLSYSFMTDITFIMYVLAACLCYVRGAQGYGERWLWLGSVATALAYLTRQVGVFAVLGVLIYLWWARRWSWRSALAVAAIPLAVTAAYMLWESAQPQRFVAVYLDLLKAMAWQHPADYAINKLESLATTIATPGLCLLPLLRFPRKPLRALPLLIFIVGFQALNYKGLGTMFPALGNLVADSGFSTGHENMTPIWGEWVWTLLSIVGIAAFCLYITSCLEWTFDWLKRQRTGEHSDDPALILYALGAILAAVSFIVPPVHFDRYWLPIMPALMLPALRRVMDDGRRTTDDGGWPIVQNLNTRKRVSKIQNPLVRWLLVLPLALFSIVGMRDYMEHSALRWQGAESLVASGVRPNQIDAGFEWMGQYLYRDGVEYMRRTHDFTNIVYPGLAVLDPVYVVSDMPHDGYTQIEALPYHSWLEAGQPRYVLLLKRN